MNQELMNVFGTAKEIVVGPAKVLAQRISYVGELGWELYAPVESLVPLFDQLTEAGASFDLRLAGYHALDSLRAEKGLLHWGADIGPADTPYEGGIGFTVALDKPGGFDVEDQAAIEGYADQAALLLRNARLYEELQRSYERLRDAQRNRDYFLQNVNHELRTPLTAILGWSEVLSEDRPDKETVKIAVDQINRWNRWTILCPAYLNASGQPHVWFGVRPSPNDARSDVVNQMNTWLDCLSDFDKFTDAPDAFLKAHE